MQETQPNEPIPGHLDAPVWHYTRRGYSMALSAMDDIATRLRQLLAKSEPGKLKPEQMIAAIENHLWDDLCKRNGRPSYEEELEAGKR